MSVRFGDLYEEYITLEQAINRMEIDIENSPCDSVTKCRLELELGFLKAKFESISSTEFDFERLNFVSVIDSIERCLHCITFGEDIEDIAPPPYGSASSCRSGELRRISLKDIEKIYVTEGTASSNTFDFVKSSMPFEITTTASERYVVTYDSFRDGISIKGFNTNEGANVSNFGNIGKVEVELNDAAKKKFGVSKVMACKVLLTTPTPMGSLAPLYLAVDGNSNTYPRVASTDEMMVELVFEFWI